MSSGRLTSCLERGATDGREGPNGGCCVPSRPDSVVVFRSLKDQWAAMDVSDDRGGRTPTLGELRAFVVAAEELHFARAARRLGVAGPSLSQTIRRLEAALGKALLTRTPRNVALTE